MSGEEQQQQDERAISDENVGGDESDSDDKKKGRRKIDISFIENKSRRHITFSKRKAGIMKKAYELATLTGTQVLLLVASETGHVYTFATPKLQPLITNPEGKNLIQACLNAPDQSAPETPKPVAQQPSFAPAEPERSKAFSAPYSGPAAGQQPPYETKYVRPKTEPQRMEDTRNLTFPQQTQPSMFQGQGMQVQPMQGQGMQGQGMPGQGMQAQSLPQHLQHGMAPFPNMNPAYSSHSQFYPQPRQSQQMQAQPGQNPQQQQQQGMAGQVPLAQQYQNYPRQQLPPNYMGQQQGYMPRPMGMPGQDDGNDGSDDGSQ